MINYRKFVQKCITKLPGLLEQDLGNITVEKADFSDIPDKNYIGISVRREGEAIARCYDLKEFYELLKLRDDVDSLIEFISTVILDSFKCPEPDISIDFTNIDVVKKSICINATSYTRNKDGLQSVPHIQMGDIAMICRLVYVNDDGNVFRTNVDYKLLEHIGITEDELFELAYENSPKNWPAYIHNIMDLPVNKKKIDDDNDADKYLWFVGYKDIGGGAGTIFDKELMCDIANKMGCSFYIIAVTVNELMIMGNPGDVSLEFVQEWANRVNPVSLPEREMLTTSVYYYNKDTKYLGPAYS